MFSEDIEAVLSMWQDRNHIELLLKIEAYCEARGLMLDDYDVFNRESLHHAIKTYLQTYGHTKEMD